MEYIKKEELIEGEIYKSTLYGDIFKYLDKNGGNNPNILKSYFKIGASIGYGLNNIIKATPEEKHWLNECIKLDKFITFEEAMKTFIPEYVECTKHQEGSDYKLGKIYKIGGRYIMGGFGLYVNNTYRFKPSTKEAYDAQFVVKEPEFVLPEKWCIKFSHNEKLLNWCKKNTQTHFTSFEKLDVTNNNYFHYPLNTIQVIEKNCNYTEITFEQFKKYVLKEEVIEEKVIEPLPQFKVIETIETITKVENNEGNQFFIGDNVKSLNSNQKGKITKFKYSNDKSNIIAITTFQQTNGININKIEHYIEPKIEFILPEKWCITTTIENQSIIFDWLEKNTNWGGRYSGVNTNIGNHYCIEGKKCNGWMYYAPQHKSGYKELTFEEFKKYVLNENN